MQETIHIACASDERYFPGLLATLTSIIINTKYQGEIVFHVIDGGIEKISWEFLVEALGRIRNTKFLRYEIDQSHFTGFPDFYFDSKMAYARLLLPTLISEDKIMYVDSDILFLKDIQELWSMDFSGKAAMAASEVTVPRLKDDCPNLEEFKLNPNAPYFNSGVMYIDLNKFRLENICSKTMHYLEQYSDNCKFWDQSALNVTLYNNYVLLDQSWNTQSHREAFKVEERLNDLVAYKINYHFVTSFKPWLHYNESPPNLIFYALLEELGYSLESSKFKQSKKAYQQKIRLGNFLPMIYKLRSLFSHIKGDKQLAASNNKTAKFWKEQIPILKFQKTNRVVIEQVITAWRKRIQKALDVKENVIG